MKLRIEILIVLGLSLGKSAIYSGLSLWRKLTNPAPLSQQTTTMNSSVVVERPWLDFAYQVAGLILPLVPVFLALYLLSIYRRPEGGAFGAMGFDLRQPGKDLLIGVGSFAVIGIAGLGLYLGARQLGLNTNIVAANLAAHWWTIPVLVLSAVKSGVLEEVVMVGYLFTRWTQSGGRAVTVLIGSALIRGSYHLYQGFGGFIGNAIMGLIFGAFFLKTKRVMPLVIVHILLDVASFVGYALLKDYLPFL